MSAVLPVGPWDKAQTLEVLADIAKERQRQVEVEGWSTEHDDAHTDRSLVRAAAAYAWYASLPTYVRLACRRPDNYLHRMLNDLWPANWSWSWFKPCDPSADEYTTLRERELVKAAALITAEIERHRRERRRWLRSGPTAGTEAALPPHTASFARGSLPRETSVEVRVSTEPLDGLAAAVAPEPAVPGAQVAADDANHLDPGAGS